jgi:hypothetical protein
MKAAYFKFEKFIKAANLKSSYLAGGINQSFHKFS